MKKFKIIALTLSCLFGLNCAAQATNKKNINEIPNLNNEIQSDTSSENESKDQDSDSSKKDFSQEITHINCAGVFEENVKEILKNEFDLKKSQEQQNQGRIYNRIPNLDENLGKLEKILDYLDEDIKIEKKDKNKKIANKVDLKNLKIRQKKRRNYNNRIPSRIEDIRNLKINSDSSDEDVNRGYINHSVSLQINKKNININNLRDDLKKIAKKDGEINENFDLPVEKAEKGVNVNFDLPVEKAEKGINVDVEKAEEGVNVNLNLPVEKAEKGVNVNFNLPVGQNINNVGIGGYKTKEFVLFKKNPIKDAKYLMGVIQRNFKDLRNSQIVDEPTDEQLYLYQLIDMLHGDIIDTAVKVDLVNRGERLIFDRNYVDSPYINYAGTSDNLPYMLYKKVYKNSYELKEAVRRNKNIVNIKKNDPRAKVYPLVMLENKFKFLKNKFYELLDELKK